MNDNTPDPNQEELPEYTQSGFYSSQPGYTPSGGYSSQPDYTETQPSAALPYGAQPTPPGGSAYAPTSAYSTYSPPTPDTTQGLNGAPWRRGAGRGWRGGRRWLMIGVAVIIALLLLGGVAWVVDAAQGAGTPTARATATSAPTATAAPQHAALPVYTVATVNGNTITAAGTDGATITISVTSTTKITLLDQPTTLSAIIAGTRIRVQGRMQGNTITARRIQIVPPVIAGQLTAISGMTLTVQTAQHGSVTITITSTTIYHTGQSLSTLHVGDEITVAVSKNSDGSYTALGIADRTAATASPTPSA